MKILILKKAMMWVIKARLSVRLNHGQSLGISVHLRCTPLSSKFSGENTAAFDALITKKLLNLEDICYITTHYYLVVGT